MFTARAIATAVAFAFALMASSCGKTPPAAGLRKIAVVPFENLTGDASLDWVRTAGPAMLADELEGSSHVTVLGAGSLADARQAGANEVLHTYFTRGHDALRVHYEIQDTKLLHIAPVALTTGTLLASVDRLAHDLDPQARGFSSSNAAAVEAWGRGEFERAVGIDPDFGAGWVGWVRMLAQSGKADDALQVADRAVARKTLRTDWSRGQLRVLIATLEKDVPARAAAMTELAKLAPSDVEALTAAAGAQSLARDFQASADLLRKLLAVDPSDAAAMNSLGYAEAFRGNLDAARATFENYGKQPGSQVNSHDSLGEAYFMNGRFREAEKEFNQAIALDPNFLGGASMVKAAYAHWLAGDLPGADRTIQKYVAAIAKSNVPFAVWREAAWLYSTGRREQAEAMLMKSPTDDRFRQQLAIWSGAVRFPTDLESLRSAYLAAEPAMDGLERVLYASALVEAGKQSEARAILQRWPLPESSRRPELDTIVFPKYIELRKKLGILP